MADRPETTSAVSAAAFLAQPETDEHLELIQGEVIMSPSAKYPHQKAAVQLIQLLGRLLTEGELQFEIDVAFDNHVLRPDIFWVAPGNQACEVGEDSYWHGPPDLVIEILSPATELRDRGVKYNIYERAGVREYWLVDPASRYFEIYVLAAEHYIRYGVFGPDQTFTSPILNGQQVPVGAILGPIASE